MAIFKKDKNILRDDIEYIIHSDSNGNIIGPISRNHAHTDRVRSALTHYSTWSMVYHLKSGKYGIQLKNPKKHDKYGAGKWDMGAAGHNFYLKKKIYLLNEIPELPYKEEILGMKPVILNGDLSKIK